MGLAAAAEIIAKLMEHGADAATPAAIVDNGTRDNQQVVDGSLGDIAGRLAEANLEGPAILIVGGVVTLRDKLAWFATRRPGGSLTQAR